MQRRKEYLTGFFWRSSVPHIQAIVYSGWQVSIAEAEWNDCRGQNEPTWRKGLAMREFKDTSRGLQVRRANGVEVRPYG